MKKKHVEVFKRTIASVLCAGVVLANPLTALATSDAVNQPSSSSDISVQETEEGKATEQPEDVTPQQEEPVQEVPVQEPEQEAEDVPSSDAEAVEAESTPSEEDSTSEVVTEDKGATFVAASLAIDQKALLQAATQAGLAKAASEKDPENAELKDAAKSAAAEWTSAMGAVSDVLDMYDMLGEEDLNKAGVFTAYNSMLKLVSNLQDAYNNPKVPSEDDKETDESTTPETAKTETAKLNEIIDHLYSDLPIAPSGYYIGKKSGLPIGTGSTAISIEGWGTEGNTIEEGAVVAYDTSLFKEEHTEISVPHVANKDYAIAPISVQLLFPADKSTINIELSDGAELLSYSSSDENPVLATDEEASSILTQRLDETTAAAYGFLVMAENDFTATITYTSGGHSIVKDLAVKIDDTAEPSEVMAYYSSVDEEEQSLLEENNGTAGVDTMDEDFGVDTMDEDFGVDTMDEDFGVDALDDEYDISAQDSTVTPPSPPSMTGTVTAVVNQGGIWLTKFNGKQALCGDKGKWSWAPGASFANTHGTCTYTYSSTVWVNAADYNKGWAADQATYWSIGAKTGTPTAASAQAIENDDVAQPMSVDEVVNQYPEFDWICENYPDSRFAMLGTENGISTQAGEKQIYFGFLYTPSNPAWQRMLDIDYTLVTLGGDVEVPGEQPQPEWWEIDVSESAEATKEISFDYTVNIQKESTIDETALADAKFEIESNIGTNGECAGGEWELTDVQTVTTDDNGQASATFTFSYSVTTSSTSETVHVGPYESEAERDAAEASKRNELQGAAQDAADAAADAACGEAEELASTISFHVSEIMEAHGFTKTGDGEFSQPIDDQPGEQDVDVDADDESTVTVENENWNSHVEWEKIDYVTGGRLTEDTQFEFLEWDGNNYVVSPNYKVIRRDDGLYTVQCTNDDYRRTDDNGGYSAQNRSDEGNVFYTLTNLGKYKIQEVNSAYGYTADNNVNGGNAWSVEFAVTGNNDDHSFTKDGNHSNQVDANRPWKTKVVINKVDSETGKQITNDSTYSLYEWDESTDQFIISKNYKVERQGDGTYTIVPAHDNWYTRPENGWLSFEDTLGDERVATTPNADHTTVNHPQYYTGNNVAGNGTEGRADRADTNDGQFIVVEHNAPAGYFGDWTDIENPNPIAGSDIGKRAYYIRLTSDLDGQTIMLSNNQYNADITAEGAAGASKIVTANGNAFVSITNNGAAKDATRVYDTDNSRDAANENDYTMTPKDSVFQNDRVLGEISLSKVDLEAVAYVNGRTANETATATGESHGDSTMDGAIYDLYVANDIQHPDGKTGVVDYSTIKYGNGNNIWHTTMIQNGGFTDGEYLPVLSKDHLVASAKIENGWLTFANLYLGNYYIVERGKGVTIPVSTSGAYYVDGTYPNIDAKLNQNGTTSPLASVDGQYTDYVYRNQFTITAANRALDGTVMYDGYYESYSDGYLCDEHNYYITPNYFNESAYVVKTMFEDNRQAEGEEIDKTQYLANYHIIRDNNLAESDDQVMKGNVEIDKRNSGTGTSDGSPLEGAGFTFYLISDLTKADQISTARTGAYRLSSLINLYVNRNYNETDPKFDFSNETQAIAKTYEIDADKIAAYNLKLTEAGDFKSGSGAGWVPTGTKNEYQLSEMFTNDVGVVRVDGLPYGQYVVVETTVPDNKFQADPFIITIDASSQIPQSDMANPKDAVLIPSNAYVNHRSGVLNEDVEMYLRIYKKDVETGKTVLRAGTTYQIYWMDENGNYMLDGEGHPRLVTMTTTVDGSVNKNQTEFVSSENGTIALPEKLPVGYYRLVEIEALSGYYNEWIDTAEYDTNGVLKENPDGTFSTGSYYVDFEVSTNRDFDANATDNEDNQDVIVIDENYWNNETIGMVTLRKVGNVLTGYKDGNFVYTQRNLAGATYEITAKEDIVTPDNQKNSNGENTVWYKAGDVVATVTTGKDGQIDSTDFAPMRTPATYDFLNVTHDGTLGEVSITLPLGSYTVKETKAPFGFLLTEKYYDFTLSWGNQCNDFVLAETISEAMQDGTFEIFTADVVRLSDATEKDFEDRILEFENARELPVPETPETSVDKVGLGVYKKDKVTGKFVAGAVFNLYTDDDIYDVDGNKLFTAGDLVAVSPETNADGFTYFEQDVPMRGEFYEAPAEGETYNPDVKDITTNSGNYTIVEVKAPLGYFLEETPMHLSFIFDGQPWEVLNSTNLNQPTITYVDKRDLTNDKELPGATLKIVNTKGETFEEWVSTTEPHPVYGLHFDEEYKLVETRPTPGYAYASDITFKVVQEKDDEGNLIKANDVYYLSGYKPGILGPEKVWTRLDKDTVIMKDDITKVSISKVDITNNKELPGAHLTISNKDGTVEEWTSTNEPHYIEKLPAGDYTLTEVTAPDGYLKAESINFTVDAIGDIQHVTMKDMPNDSGLLITKVDATSKELLKGIDFQIVDSKGNIVQWKDANGNMRDCYNTTNDAGNIWFGLPYGTYFYQEIRWTPEYQGDSTPVMFVIDEGHRQVEVVVENKRALLYGLIKFFKGSNPTNGGVTIPATGMGTNGTGEGTVTAPNTITSTTMVETKSGNVRLVIAGVTLVVAAGAITILAVSKRKKKEQGSTDEESNSPEV